MSKSNDLESDFINYFFRGTVPSWGSNASGWIALFTADPTDTLSVLNEATYTGYIRTVFLRSSGGIWTQSVSGTTSTNSGQVNLATCTGGGSQVVTHAAIVTTSGGVCQGYTWQLPQAITVSNGITPFIPNAALTISED